MLQIPLSIFSVEISPTTLRCCVAHNTDSDVCSQVQLAKDPEDSQEPLEDKGFADLLSSIRDMVASDEEGYKHYLAKEKTVCLHVKGMLEEIGNAKDARVLKVCKCHSTTSHPTRTISRFSQKSISPEA
jgi:hypothetical protein